MRTTVTLDADVAALVRQAMADRTAGFKEVVNEAIRRGLTDGDHDEPYELPTFDMGVPLVPLDRALQLASDLEDEERRRKLARRK